MLKAIYRAIDRAYHARRKVNFSESELQTLSTALRMAAWRYEELRDAATCQGYPGRAEVMEERRVAMDNLYVKISIIKHIAG